MANLYLSAANQMTFAELEILNQYAANDPNVVRQNTNVGFYLFNNQTHRAVEIYSTDYNPGKLSGTFMQIRAFSNITSADESGAKAQWEIEGFSFSIKTFATHVSTNAVNAVKGDLLKGDDKLFGNDKANTLYGYNGNDKIYGGLGNDTLYGGAGNDELHGQTGKNTVYGQGGNDDLYGESGLSTLFGGAGKDRFFLDINYKTVDIVKDFQPGKDKIVLAGAQGFFAVGPANKELKATYFRAGPKPLDADDKVIYDKATGKLFFDYDGNKKTNPSELLMKIFDHDNHHPKLDAHDFFVL